MKIMNAVGNGLRDASDEETMSLAVGKFCCGYSLLSLPLWEGATNPAMVGEPRF
jgi:hypothetical protein